MKSIFVFNKERGFDSIVENSFKYFFKHIKPMMKIFWKYNPVIIVGFVISYFLYFYFYFGIFDKIRFRTVDVVNNEDFTMKFALVALFLIVFSIALFPKFLGTVFGYIQVYMENEGEVDEEKVNMLAKQKFWGFIGLSFLVGLVFGIFVLIFIGLTVFGGGGAIALGFIIAIPLIFYLTVFLSLVYPTYFYEDTGVVDAIYATIRYIKNKFWFSFLVIFVMSILVGIIGAVFNAPVMVYTIVKEVSATTGDTFQGVGENGDIVVAAFSIVSMVAQYILKVVVLIATALLFFSNKEFHTQEGSFNRIDSIGKDE